MYLYKFNFGSSISYLKILNNMTFKLKDISNFNLQDTYIILYLSILLNERGKIMYLCA